MIGLAEEDFTLNWPKVDCFCRQYFCLCGTTERVLRGYSEGYKLPPMTDAQRNYCINQIKMVEGFDYTEHLSDMDLARTVLDAWTDYCRNQGLL